jgi:hypothetical protein
LVVSRSLWNATLRRFQPSIVNTGFAEFLACHAVDSIGNLLVFQFRHDLGPCQGGALAIDEPNDGADDLPTSITGAKHPSLQRGR